MMKNAMVMAGVMIQEFVWQKAQRSEQIVQEEKEAFIQTTKFVMLANIVTPKFWSVFEQTLLVKNAMRKILVNSDLDVLRTQKQTVKSVKTCFQFQMDKKQWLKVRRNIVNQAIATL